MTASPWLQIGFLIALLAISTPILGAYLAQIYSGEKAPGDRVFLPIERAIYRVSRIDPEREQRWTVYAYSLLAFSLVSGLVLYAQLRLQGHLPLNPDHMKAVPAGLSFNTSMSFLTNTNWQNYSGESTMAHLTQMAGLAVHNFVSAAAGAAVAVALIRGLVRRRSATLGNFWVDLTRTTVRVLLPLSFVVGMVFISQGVVQNFHSTTAVTTVEGQTQSIPGGPIASQEAIKNIGQNGGGPYNANSAHPFENPNPITNILIIWMILAIPFAFPWAFGKMAKDTKQGVVVLAAMFAFWFVGAIIAMPMEARGNRNLAAAGADQQVTAVQAGGNMEGKETRFGPAGCGLFADSTTGTSTGSINCAHDSMVPIGGAVPLVNIMLGEVTPGGTGSGLYGMLVFALTSVFIAGLMVGRTPEYLGKKIQATEMKLVVVYLVVVPLATLAFAATAVLLKTTLSSLANDGPHGLTEMLYAFVSSTNNNGSAFGGLTGNTQFFNTVLGLCYLIGRFMLMIPVLAIAGSLGRKQPVPESAGTFPTGTPLFAGLLVGVVVIVVGLTYFPVIALGPVVEHLAGKF
ncbi:MAG TPA: potassium-transporting ATPase subunit KdpA [Acidimicrobiales bacterium]|nr:potassium-transporting ATPase subunit KdpA [Acidimicrobiales bacterium]